MKSRPEKQVKSTKTYLFLKKILKIKSSLKNDNELTKRHENKIILKFWAWEEPCYDAEVRFFPLKIILQRLIFFNIFSPFYDQKVKKLFLFKIQVKIFLYRPRYSNKGLG